MRKMIAYITYQLPLEVYVEDPVNEEKIDEAVDEALGELLANTSKGHEFFQELVWIETTMFDPKEEEGEEE